MRKLISLTLYFLVALFISAPSFANKGDICIDGEITNRNYEGGYILSAKEFNTLEKSHIKTTTSWTVPGELLILKA